MTTRELIESYLEEERNRVFDASADWHMDRARTGRETEFAAAQERVALLEDLLDELLGVTK